MGDDVAESNLREVIESFSSQRARIFAIFGELGKRDCRSIALKNELKASCILLINFHFHVKYQRKLRWIPIETVDEFDFVRRFVDIVDSDIIDKEVTLEQFETGNVLYKNPEFFEFVIKKLDDVCFLESVAVLHSGDVV